MPVIPKAVFSDDELKNVLLIGFDKAKNDDRNLNRTMQLYNTFRNRWCGAYLASKGIRVIPTVNWGDETTFDFCFEGIPKGSIVAVSTYMVQEHNNHSDQKEFFLKGHHEMLKRIEPSKIICYSEPFPEMQGNIISVDYELSGWKYQNKSQENLLRNNTHDIMIYKTTVQPDCFFDGMSEGSGSAYGGKWKPKEPGGDRFLGKPGERKFNSDDHDMKRLTKIGAEGRAVKERHCGDHTRSDKHTPPTTISYCGIQTEEIRYRKVPSIIRMAHQNLNIIMEMDTK